MNYFGGLNPYQPRGGLQSSGLQIDSLVPETVPEPSTALIFAAGLASLLITRRQIGWAKRR